MTVTATRGKSELQELMDRCEHAALATWALDCAQRVLPLFAGSCLGDGRPEQAIETGRAWVRGELPMWQARKQAFAAHAAAREAQCPAAVAAARSAGQALGAVHVRGHATYAAEYARKAVALAAGNAEEERQWQIKHLRELIQVQTE